MSGLLFKKHTIATLQRNSNRHRGKNATIAMYDGIDKITEWKWKKHAVLYRAADKTRLSSFVLFCLVLSCPCRRRERNWRPVTTVGDRNLPNCLVSKYGEDYWLLKTVLTYRQFYVLSCPCRWCKLGIRWAEPPLWRTWIVGLCRQFTRLKHRQRKLSWAGRT